MNMGLITLLLIVGLAFVVAEAFFPSMGVLSILAAVSLVSAVFLAFQEGQLFGFIALVIAVVGAPTAFYFAFKALPKTSFGRNFLLAGPNPEETVGSAAAPGLEALVGKAGETVTPLRPAGIARIDGRRVDVISRGEMLEAGVEVVVVKADSNRVVVAVQQGGSVSPETRSPAG